MVESSSVMLIHNLICNCGPWLAAGACEHDAAQAFEAAALG